MYKTIVVASGYFEPNIHPGHLEYLCEAKKLGDILIVIVNNDHQTVLKKGVCTIPASDRIKIVRALKFVDVAVEAIDEDRTVCKTLAMLHPHVFANGGDTHNVDIPESEVCERMNIKMVDGLGKKIQSSRWIMKRIKENFGSINEDYLSGK
uniref:Cytidylyltransferase-like protein n=1 Tax=Pithovirus LCPAC304 TaxID=2506594 RepID=A0A481Z9S3_9VIRU|nr:MAG: cytidylyltransferase-like protein [Pithovirus LCPAC304]